MKKILLAVLVLASTCAQAHQYWPDDYTVMKQPGKETLIVTHLRSEDTANFSFTLNGMRLGSDSQLVFADQTTDFPVYVPNDMIKNELVTICSQKQSTDTLQQEVCLRIKVQ